MARRYRRDLIGHFIRRRQREQQPCTHACCRGYRVHPKNMPVILPDRTLRQASDDDLAEHFKRVNRSDTDEARRAEAQILHEMERRDRVESERREHREAVRGRRAAQRMERESEYERIAAEAEDYTKGYLVTPQGQARGITDRELLTGREDLFIRYATPEAKAYFSDHPRPTAAYFRGRDTTVPYSDRPTRQRRPVRGRGIAYLNRPARGRRAA